MDTREKIIEFIRITGPILPVKLAKELNTNILMASAFLSELVSSGRIRVSYIKIGGSPLYYLAGQEHRLQSFATTINEKEKSAYDKLCKAKILIEKELEPLTRVALKELRDFAIQFQFENEMYWRWYLVSESEAIIIIKNSVQKSLPVISSPPKESPLQKNEPEIKQQPQLEIKSVQISTKKRVISNPTETIRKVRDYLEQNDIDVENISYKKTEIECLVRLSTKIGKIGCYCKGNFKKRITDADISSAYLQSQYMGLPLLFLYSGELSKKAQEMLKAYPNIIINKL
ncbi:MAG: hypothetical protein AABY14_04215 [Nanoarchaeota archaeon]|mgnify:CR=1 FL=1